MPSINFVIFLMWISYGLHGGLMPCAELTDEYDRIIMFKEPASNKALNGHVIRTEKVPDEKSCRVECYLEPNCVSVNVGPNVGGHHVCELSNATDESPTLSNLSNRKSYTYYGIENWCHSNPCHGKYEVCLVGFTERGFTCACREPWIEKQCTEDCHGALGMQNGTIHDEQISASSQLDDNYAANQGRLHFQATGALKGAWSAGSNDANQWLQVYLGCNSFIITKVATQGRNGCCSQWVITYNLQYGDDMTNFQYYREQGGSIKNFDGNTDQDTVVYRELNPPIKARYIRFRPLTWENHVSMRAEVYGCSKGCPDYWKRLQTSQYAVFSSKKSWEHAEEFCRSMDAHLAKIESRDESLSVKSLLGDLNANGLHWIGLSDIEVENNWKWSDGSLLGPHNPWSPDSQNSPLANCVGIYGHPWHFKLCSRRQKFICEKKTEAA